MVRDLSAAELLTNLCWAGEMPKRHLAAALMVPSPWAAEIDGLRRACEDPMLSRVAPHITLVPPINVPETAMPEVLASLRRAAAGCRALNLVIGPPTTFRPITPLAYLAVTGETWALDALAQLQSALV